MGAFVLSIARSAAEGAAHPPLTQAYSHTKSPLRTDANPDHPFPPTGAKRVLVLLQLSPAPLLPAEAALPVARARLMLVYCTP